MLYDEFINSLLYVNAVIFINAVHPRILINKDALRNQFEINGKSFLLVETIIDNIIFITIFLFFLFNEIYFTQYIGISGS